MTSMTNVLILSSFIIMFIALVSSVPMQQEEPSDTVDADGTTTFTSKIVTKKFNYLLIYR